MTDLVERLRTGKIDGNPTRWAVTDLSLEAADEIERLRAIIAGMITRTTSVDELDRLTGAALQPKA